MGIAKDFIKCYVKSKAYKDLKPDASYGIKQEMWRKCFGKELPTVYELVAQAKETVAKARLQYK